ncbi:MAG: small multi-drug export protein [Chloroflexi bacterium]|nr:small multi-drug export protein [Chloroflexota bacterium]
MVELWAAIPAGLALQLDPVVTGVSAAGGNIAGSAVVGLLGERARTWLILRRGRGQSRHHGRLSRIWRRYGIVGLALAAPMVTGAPLATALGMALGAPMRYLLAWMALSIVFWSVVLTAAAVLDLAGIKALFP